MKKQLKEKKREDLLYSIRVYLEEMKSEQKPNIALYSIEELKKVCFLYNLST